MRFAGGMYGLKEIFNVISNAYNSYNNLSTYYTMGSYVVLLVIVLIWSYYNKNKIEEQKRIIDYTLLSLILCMFIPTATVIMDLLLTREAYYQIFWILPIIIVIAYCAIKISYDFDKHKFDKITLLFFVIILLMSGVNPFLNTNFYKTNKYETSDNNLKINNNIIYLANYLNELDQNIRIIAPPDIMFNIRKYTSNIKTLYGIDITMEDASQRYTAEIIAAYNTMKLEIPDINYVLQIAENTKCNIIILQNETVSDYIYESWDIILSMLEYGGFYPVNYFEEYTVFLKDTN